MTPAASISYVSASRSKRAAACLPKIRPQDVIPTDSETTSPSVWRRFFERKLDTPFGPVPLGRFLGIWSAIMLLLVTPSLF